MSDPFDMALTEMATELRAARVELERSQKLASDLLEYVQHETGCPAWYPEDTTATRQGQPMKEWPCDCGLAELEGQAKVGG